VGRGGGGGGGGGGGVLQYEQHRLPVLRAFLNRCGYSMYIYAVMYICIERAREREREAVLQYAQHRLPVLRAFLQRDGYNMYIYIYIYTVMYIYSDMQI